jgi:uncharacterized protein (DUF934 family)
MALLEAGRLVPDPWTPLAEGAAPTAGGAFILPLARWLAERESLAGSDARLGLRLPSATRLEPIAADLPRLALLALEFPKFRDGRGFTLARALRERYCWSGEIRAVGHVIPDQYQFLARVGVTTVELPEGASPASWAAALRRFSIGYQADGQALGALSRRLDPASFS